LEKIINVTLKMTIIWVLFFFANETIIMRPKEYMKKYNTSKYSVWLETWSTCKGFNYVCHMWCVIQKIPNHFRICVEWPSQIHKLITNIPYPLIKYSKCEWDTKRDINFPNKPKMKENQWKHITHKQLKHIVHNACAPSITSFMHMFNCS
jgi:hypothetical protein